MTPEERKIAEEMYIRYTAGLPPPRKKDPKLHIYQTDPALYIEERLGAVLTPDQRMICDALMGHRRVLVKASHGVGKCFHEDEWLSLADGTSKRVKDLIGTNFQILTLNENQEIVTAAALAEWNSFEDTTYTLRTRSGKTIRRNSDHPLWAVNNRLRTIKNTVKPLHSTLEADAHWVKMKDLQPGDYVAVVNTMPAFGQVATKNKFQTTAKRQLKIRNQLKWLEDRKELLESFESGTLRKYLRSYLGYFATLGANPDTYRIRNDFMLSITFPEAKRESALLLQRLCLKFGIHWYTYPISRVSTNGLTYNYIRMRVIDTQSFENLLSKKGSSMLIAEHNIRQLLYHELARRKRNFTRGHGFGRTLRWEQISSIEKDEGPQRTVAICVPGYETLITPFYEHNSFIAAALALWHYYVWNPGKVVTTAPNKDQVKDIIWGSMRSLGAGNPAFPFFPSAPGMQDASQHFAVGRTGRDSNAFQGIHHKRLLLIFDEAVGIRKDFWIAAENMAVGVNNRILAICNPTDISSAAYEYDGYKSWHSISISSLTHPNVLAGINGQEVPYDGATTYESIMEQIEQHCTPVKLEDVDITRNDFEFPPGKGQWWHPDPIFEARQLGKWPSSSTSSIWGEALFGQACSGYLPRLDPREDAVPIVWSSTDQIEIGVDVGYTGDATSIHARRGPVSLMHETYKGYNTSETAGAAKRMANLLGIKHGQDPRTIKIKIDADGLGVGVLDQKGDYRFVGIRASSKAVQPDRYPNRRSELWFAARDKAKVGGIDIGDLPGDMLELLKKQLLMPTWKPDSAGRITVEKKEETKKRLHRSPDDADAFNLAYAQDPDYMPPIILRTPSATMRNGRVTLSTTAQEPAEKILTPEQYAAEMFARSRNQSSRVRF